jgi:hypothetical protein
MTERSLYDVTGSAIAYIADDNEESIYLWSGHAVAYISNENIFGWNGQHLGWFVDGIIYDLQGRRVGFVRERCPVATYTQPAKYAKYAKYRKICTLWSICPSSAHNRILGSEFEGLLTVRRRLGIKYSHCRCMFLWLVLTFTLDQHQRCTTVAAHP